MGGNGVRAIDTSVDTQNRPVMPAAARASSDALRRQRGVMAALRSETTWRAGSCYILRMKAVVFHAPHDVRVESVPDAALASERGVVVRVSCASICGSDLHPYHGTMPIPPGVILG